MFVSMLASVLTSRMATWKRQQLLLQQQSTQQQQQEGQQQQAGQQQGTQQQQQPHLHFLQRRFQASVEMAVQAADMLWGNACCVLSSLPPLPVTREAREGAYPVLVHGMCGLTVCAPNTPQHQAACHLNRLLICMPGETCATAAALHDTLSLAPGHDAMKTKLVAVSLMVGELLYVRLQQWMAAIKGAPVSVDQQMAELMAHLSAQGEDAGTCDDTLGSVARVRSLLQGSAGYQAMYMEAAQAAAENRWPSGINSLCAWSHKWHEGFTAAMRALVTEWASGVSERSPALATPAKEEGCPVGVCRAVWGAETAAG